MAAGAAAPTQVALFLPSVTTRPTYRSVQTKGKQDKKRAIPVVTILPARAYRDLLNGFRVEYPHDWSYTFPAPDTGSSAAHYDWTLFGGGIFPNTSLAVGVLNLKKSVTTADLKKDFSDYTRKPTFAEDFQNPRFLIMYALVSSETQTWNGRETLVSTFTHRLRSRNMQVRQMRIPAGNRIILLEYSTTTDRFVRDLHFFEDFRRSFVLLI
ncbi:MAG: hypothetical protein PHX93_02425 [Candidatus Peribacteraceae bacterium]|jgi:hypothetical protein|nr:hypothetical protein [Candidatus Peribacteraceae bacterium]